MMEEEPDIDLHETLTTAASISDDLHIPQSLESIDLLCDSSTTSVVGEMTGKLEDEDLMDDPVLLTSSSKTTPQHNTLQQSIGLGVQIVGQGDSALASLGLKSDVDAPAFSLDNINLSESHSSFSDLGQTLPADSGSYDRISPSFDGAKAAESEVSEKEIGLLQPGDNPSGSSENRIFGENELLSQSGEITGGSADVSKYFEDLTVDDPFDFSTATQTSPDPIVSQVSQETHSQLLSSIANIPDKADFKSTDAVNAQTVLGKTTNEGVGKQSDLIGPETIPLVATSDTTPLAASSDSALFAASSDDTSGGASSDNSFVPQYLDCTAAPTYPESAVAPTYPESAAGPAHPEIAAIPTNIENTPITTCPSNQMDMTFPGSKPAPDDTQTKVSSNSIQDFFRQSSQPENFNTHGSAILPDTFSPTRTPQGHLSDGIIPAPFVNNIQHASSSMADIHQTNIQDTGVNVNRYQSSTNVTNVYPTGTPPQAEASMAASRTDYSSALSDQLSQNANQTMNQVQQVSNNTINPEAYASSTPDAYNAAQSPHHPVYCTPGTQYTDQSEESAPMYIPQQLPRNVGNYGGPLSQISPLFVPSVYNYSTKPTNQPQIFTPAPQDFSSHMTYSSSPSKYFDESEGQFDGHPRMNRSDSGLWSWVKHTVNADWAEGAQKIGKQLMEKTKHATDTVLTTLDPGMEEYLSKTDPVTNIALGSNQEPIVQGIRQGFRNILGHVVVKGESVRHNQAPLPVGFSSGIAAVCDKLNVLANTKFSFQGSYVTVATEVFLTELEQQRWNAMFCLGLRDSQYGLDIRTFSQPIPLPFDCVSVAYSKSSPQNLQSGYGIPIEEAVRLVRPSESKDWCSVMTGFSLCSLLTMASQCLAADYRRHLESMTRSNPQAVVQW